MIWPWGSGEFGGGDSSEGRKWLWEDLFGNSDKPSVSDSVQSEPPKAEESQNKGSWFFGL